MEDNHQQIKRNTLTSTLSLFFQSGYSAGLGLLANLVLTIVISPKIFGIYIVVLSMISFLNYFSDIGLAASLVQKKEINDDDLKTTFTVQQTLIITMIIIGYFLSPIVKAAYDLPQEGIYLYWALLLSFFLSSLKTIPSIFLERNIQFQKIVLVGIVENTIFYIAIIVFALMGEGLQSFTYAVLLRAITGLALMYHLSFWKPMIGISRESLKSLLSFGLPFQSTSLLALFKDEFITLFLGKILGLEALGYIGWAKKWAEAPIRIIMDNISRVLFPVLSRYQHDKERIASIIEKILYYQTLLLAPVMVGSMIMMPLLVYIIPKYSKWEPALPLFYLFCIAAFFSSYSSPFINLFNAVGKVKISFGFMVYWTVATWILTPLLTTEYGMIGFPLTQVILSLTCIYVMYKARSITEFSFFKKTTSSLVSAVIMGLVVFVFTYVGGADWLIVVIGSIIGVVTYLIALKSIFKINPITDIHSLFKNE